jgi:hypothetical protein
MKDGVLYRIKPVDKKSIRITYDVYKQTETGHIIGWAVTELYRWGQGFVEYEDELPYIDSAYVVTNPMIGEGAELDDGISIDFEYDDSITQDERDFIESCWENGDPNDEDGRAGAAWLYDYSDWEIEDESITIDGPFEVDKLTYVDYNIVSEERIELKPRPPLDPNSAWPFATK